MSSTSSFKRILEKYLRGEASPEEQLLIEKWFEAIGDEEDGLLITLSGSEKEKLFNSLRQSPRFRKTRRLFLLQPSWKAAAVWIGLLLGGYAVIQTVRRSKKTATQELAFTRVHTGRAEVRKILLPDSSELWLNANTTLQYAADFPSHRKVHLDGEALFEVTHRPDHPFIVETSDGLRTEVLGTRFDIKSYAQSLSSEVTVINGRIKVTHKDTLLGVLTRGQAVAYSRGDGDLRQSVVAQPETLSAWITGIWDFDNKGFADLSLLLNNQFGIRLVCRRPDLEKIKVSVNFNSRQPASEIIGIFCAFTETRSRWKDSSTVEIY